MTTPIADPKPLLTLYTTRLDPHFQSITVRQCQLVAVGPRVAYLAIVAPASSGNAGDGQLQV